MSPPHVLPKYLRRRVEQKQKDFQPCVIMYEHRKQEALLIDCRTFKKWQAAFLWLFRFLRDSWEVYAGLLDPEERDPYAGTELQDPSTPSDAEEVERHYQLNLYNLASAGDWAAAYELLCQRQGYDYEKWTEETLQDPTEPEVES